MTGEQPKCLVDANEAIRRWDAYGEELPLPTFVAMRDLLMELTTSKVVDNIREVMSKTIGADVTLALVEPTQLAPDADPSQSEVSP